MSSRTRISLALAVSALALGCGRSQRAVSPAEVKAVTAATLPSSPDDPAWSAVPVHAAPLLPQDVVEPRQLKPSTATLEAQALTDGKSIALRLAWSVPARSDQLAPGTFSDAVAVQLPAAPAAPAVGPPNPMMGEAGREVEITYWRAAWQAIVDGRPDTVAALHPNARVDTYPFESASLVPGSPEQLAMAKRYAPAVAVGNPVAGPRQSAVQDLVAAGPGTLRPAAAALSTGTGKATPTGWVVVIVRPLPKGAAPGARSQVAFAVWQGQQGEVGARKMRTGWIPLAVGGGK